jgi:hypothetical protein
MYQMVAPTREICQHLDNSRHHRLSDRALASVDGERSHFNNSVFAVAVRNPTVQPPNTLWTLTAATGCSLKPLTQSHLQKYMRFSLIHPASYSMGTGWSFMEVKWPERAADNSPPSTPIFIHGMDRENFNLTFDLTNVISSEVILVSSSACTVPIKCDKQTALISLLFFNLQSANPTCFKIPESFTCHNSVCNSALSSCIYCETRLCSPHH